MTLPVFSPRASEDLLAIAKYIAKDNLHAALDTVDKIEKRCRVYGSAPAYWAQSI
jgi:plasmid stabilization system protein ParE